MSRRDLVAKAFDEKMAAKYEFEEKEQLAYWIGEAEKKVKDWNYKLSTDMYYSVDVLRVLLNGRDDNLAKVAKILNNYVDTFANDEFVTKLAIHLPLLFNKILEQYLELSNQRSKWKIMMDKKYASILAGQNIMMEKYYPSWLNDEKIIMCFVCNGKCNSQCLNDLKEAYPKLYNDKKFMSKLIAAKPTILSYIAKDTLRQWATKNQTTPITPAGTPLANKVETWNPFA